MLQRLSSPSPKHLPAAAVKVVNVCLIWDPAHLSDQTKQTVPNHLRIYINVKVLLRFVSSVVDRVLQLLKNMIKVS